MRFALDNRVQGGRVQVFPGNAPRPVRMEHSTGFEKRFLVFLPEFATVAARCAEQGYEHDEGGGKKSCQGFHLLDHTSPSGHVLVIGKKS